MFREELIISEVKGKKVLDCGGVDHGSFETKEKSGQWLHGIIAEHAASCLGIDILEKNVEAINRGARYRFMVGDMEELTFQDEYDVVLAGEVVEHIYNIGRFLDCAWRALRSDGRLIITTPNAYSLSSLSYAGLRGRERCHPEHTCLYSSQTLRYVVSRHGFKVASMEILPRPAKHKWM